MKASTFLLGLATGSAAAAVTVLYSTPKSGSEIRSSMKLTSVDWKEKLDDISINMCNVKDSISTLATEAKETIPSAVDGIKESLNIWQQATDPNRSRLENELTAIQEAIEKLEQTIVGQKKD